jgi:phosphatidylserine decarboxylase
VWFFRDPERVTPARAGLVVSPADGIGRAVGPAIPPPELGLGNRPGPCLTVTRTLLDVHVLRVPVDGRLSKSVHVSGPFLDATRDGADLENERLAQLFTASGGKGVAVVQVAGPVVRHLGNILTDGQSVKAGQRAGFARFTLEPVKAWIERLKAGSAAPAEAAAPSDGRFTLGHLVTRIDVYLPEGTAPAVTAGQSLIAGETVLAELP